MSADGDAKKRRAALAALDLVADHATIGIGTGSTVNLFIEELARRQPHPRRAVSSSAASSVRLRAAGIEVVDLNEVGELGAYVDGADEATRARHLIKGGGGALTREKIIAAAAGRFICIIDDTKLVATLGDFAAPAEYGAKAGSQPIIIWNGQRRPGRDMTLAVGFDHGGIDPVERRSAHQPDGAPNRPRHCRSLNLSRPVLCATRRGPVDVLVLDND